MLGVLLESRAARQRRAGGATLAVVVHVAIIAAVATGAAQGTTPFKKPEVVVVSLTPPKVPVPRDVVPRTSPATRSVPTLSSVVIRRVDVPVVVPRELPPVDLRAGLASDSIVIGGASSSSVASMAGVSTVAGSETGNRDWDVREIFAHVLAQGKPRYPEQLRSAGVDGRVLVQFVVDTTGRIDPASIRILESTHELFSRAVRDALTAFRFAPAEVGGRRVSALAQMPFDFHITR